MDRACLFCLTGHPAQVSAIAVSPPHSRTLDLQYVYSAGGSEANDKLDRPARDNRIRKWALPSNQREDRNRFTSRLKRPECLLDEAPFEGHEMWVRALCLTSDGAYLFSASNDGTIMKFDAGSGAALLKMVGHGEFDDRVPSSGLWSSDHLPAAKASDPRFQWVRGIALADGLLFSVSNDWTMRSWNVTTGRQLFRYEGHENKIAGLCVGANCIYTGSNDGWVHQWSTAGQRTGHENEDKGKPREAEPACPHPLCSYSTQSAVACMTASATELFTAIYDTQLMAWKSLHMQEHVDQYKAARRASVHERSSSSRSRDGLASNGCSYDSLIEPGRRRRSISDRLTIMVGGSEDRQGARPQADVTRSEQDSADCRASRSSESRWQDAATDDDDDYWDDAHMLRLTPARRYGDISPLASLTIIVEMMITTMQFLQFSFEEESNWSDSIKAPMLAIGQLVTLRFPRELYWLGFGTSFLVMLSVVLMFLLDSHGALVRYMEKRRLAGTGIHLETDFVQKTGIKRSGPTYLEDLRLLLVRFLGLATGLLLIPIFTLSDKIFHCEYGRSAMGSSELGDAFMASTERSTAGLLLDIGGEAHSCDRSADVKYWVVAWEACLPCFEGIQLLVASISALVVALYVIVALRLSTVFQDVSLLDLIPSSGGSVLRSHLLASWRNESVPPAGAFTRDAMGSWFFYLNQTVVKVALVFTAGHLRHHLQILQVIRVGLGVWLVLMGLVFRPYASRRFCRVQVTLKVIVLYTMVWSALVSIGTSLAGKGASDWFTLCFLLSLVPVARFSYVEAGSHFPEDPMRPSVSRSYNLAKALVVKVDALAMNRVIDALSGAERPTGGSGLGHAGGEGTRGSFGRKSRESSPSHSFMGRRAEAGEKLKREVQTGGGGGLASLVGVSSVDMLA